MMTRNTTAAVIVGLPILAMASTEEPQTGTPVNLAVGIIDPQTPIFQVTRPAPVRHPRRPYLIYMVAAQRANPHPLGRQRRRCLSDLRRRRRAVLRPAIDPLGQLHAAAIQRHVYVHRNTNVI